MKWRIQFILLVMLMSTFVIGGIQLAEKGIHRVEGIEDGPTQSFRMTRAEHGKLEMTVLGRQYSLEQDLLPIQPAREHPQAISQGLIPEVQQHNWASRIGNQIGAWTTLVSQKLMGWLLG